MEELIISINDYTSIQEAINHMKSDNTLMLDNKVYDETIYIDKSVKIIGQNNTVLNFNNKQFLIEKGAIVELNNLMISIQPSNFEANLLVKNSTLKINECDLEVKTQSRDLYAAIWAENSSVTFEKMNIKSEANLIKSIHGKSCMINDNNMVIDKCSLGIEVHGSEMIEICNNIITCSMNFLRMSKIYDFRIEENEFTLPIEPILSKPRFFILDGLENGEIAQIKSNTFDAEKTLNILIHNGHSVGRTLEFADNDFRMKPNVKAAIKFDKINGLVKLDKNNLDDGKIIANQCGEIAICTSVFRRFTAIKSKHIRLVMNEKLQQIIIEDSYHIHLKNNKINNIVSNENAIKLSSIDKIRLEGNTITSVDHGVSVLNAGDNQESLFINNEFKNCKKRAINMTSTTQIKNIKAELYVKNNIFINNAKALFMDDQNMKHCTIDENYFDNNRDAVVLLGGKKTSDLKVTGNFFTASNQKIEVRNSSLCHLTHNNLTNSKIHIRGCDDILIHGNFYDNPRSKRGKCLDNEVCIKLGGHLTVSHNRILKGRVKNEVKETFDTLNITAYERHPAVTIHDNTQLEGYEKKSLFSTYQPKTLELYPDASLLSLLQYEGDTEHNLSLMDMDEVMRRDFLDLRSSFIDLKDLVQSQLIRKNIHAIVENLQIEILAGRDSNDIYRFIVKTNETVEMLKIYTTMEATVDSITEKRIVSVLSNYMEVLSGFMQKISEDEQDKLKAQINLLENLL